VAQQYLGRGALGYGMLNASIGAGAVIGAMCLPRLRKTIPANTLVTTASAMFAGVLFVLAFFHQIAMIVIVLFVAGVAWTTTTSSFNIAVQVAAPAWVQARLLGIYQMTFHAGMALGSATWGTVAQHTSTPIALSAAAVALLVTLPLARRYPISAETRDLTSAAQARALSRSAPAVVIELEPDDGPVMITVDYRIDPAEAAGFVRAVHAMRAIRLRDGAVRWGLYQDSADEAHYVETFLVESWAEYLRQRERMTVSDREVRDRIYAYQRGPVPPPVSRMIYTPTGE
jgi:MFS family permease